MKLSKNTIDVLKNFSGINQSLLLRRGKTLKTVGPGILAIAEIEEEIPVDCALYDLKQFVSVVNLFEEPDIEFGEKKAKIGNGRAHVSYTYGAELGIKVPPENVNFPEVTASFDIEWATFQAAIKAAGVLGLPEVGIVGRNGKVVLCALDKRLDEQSGNRFEMPIGEAANDFSTMAIKIENLKLLQRAYRVEVCAAGIARFSTAGLTYYVGVETTKQ